MYLDPIVQSAFVVILAWLIKIASGAIGLELDETTLNTLAAAIVAYILSRIGPPAVAGIRQGFLRRR